MTPELRGVAFPFRIHKGGLRQTAGFEKVIENVRHLLGTRLGERVMLRTYGGGAHHRLQEPNTSTLRTILRHEMEQALRTYMPEVRLTAPIQLTARESELRIAIEYKASPRNAVRRLELVLP
jgi:phage baseplate assembly protein W